MFFHSTKLYWDRLLLNYQAHFILSLNSTVWGSISNITSHFLCPVIIFLLRELSMMKLAGLMSHKSQIKNKKKNKKAAISEVDI